MRPRWRRNSLRATAELAQRNSEYGERIEHQAATIDVLKVMSASPGDPQPVFDLIVARARSCAMAVARTLFEYDGTDPFPRRYGCDCRHGTVERATRPCFPMRRSTRVDHVGRAILDRQIVHIRDTDAEPELIQAFAR